MLFNFKSKTKPKDGTALRQTDAQGSENGLCAPLSPPPPSSSLTVNKDEGLDHNHPGVPAGEIRYASLAIRTAALVADEFLLFCVQVVPLTILAICCWSISNTSILIIAIFLSIPAFLCGFLVQCWLYTAWFEHSKMSGTPGKFLFGLKVVDTKFKTLSFWQSTKRLFLQFLIVLLLAIAISLAIYLGFNVLMHNPDATRSIKTSHTFLIAFFIGTCVCLFNKRRQTLFDFVAHRFVIHSEGISKEPTWKETDNQGKLRKFRERVKECAVISWRELPGNWLKIPVAIYVLTCLAFTMCNLATVTQSIWRIAQIEGVLDKKSGIALLPLPKRLAALHIPTTTALADYKTITPLIPSASKTGYDWQKFLIDRKLELDPYDQNTQRAMAEYDLEVAKDFRKAEREYMQLANKAQFVGQSTKADSLAGAAECAINYDTKRSLYLVQSALAYNPFQKQALSLKRTLDEKFGNKAAAKEDTRRLAEPEASPFGSHDWLSDIYNFQDDTTLNTAKAGCEGLLKKDKNCTAAHIILGEYFTIKKKLSEAEQQYTIATTIDARDPLPFVDRANFYASENQFEKAIADINKALAICETEALLKKRAGFYEQSHNSEKAKSDHIRLCQLRPDVENLTEFGQFLYDNGDTAAAREMARKAQAACEYDRSLQPKIDSFESESPQVDGASLLVSLCRLQHHCGDDDGAWSTLQRLLSFAPDNGQRADLLVMLGKADQALAAYTADIDKEIESEKKKSGPAAQIRKSLAKTFARVPFASSVFGLPEDQDIPGISKDAAFRIDDKETLARLYCQRGDFHFKRGDFNKAFSDYDLAASTSDNADTARKDFAYLLANGPKKTIALVTKRISEGGYSADDQLYLSELYNRISEPAKAATCKQKAFAEINGLIKDDPKDANNIRARGQLYMRTGEFQKALSDFSRAIALNKDPDVSYYNYRARCYTALGRFDLAIKDADKAQPNTAVIPKAVSLFGKGSTKEALTEFNTAVDNDEFNANALYGRSRLYQKLGNKKAAASDLALATKYGYFINPELVRYNYDKF